jgi:hypothetical protein
MDQPQRHEIFCDMLTRYQGQVYGYILAMVRDNNDADDRSGPRPFRRAASGYRCDAGLGNPVSQRFEHLAIL